MGEMRGRLSVGCGRRVCWGLIALGSPLLLNVAACSGDDSSVADDLTGPPSTEPATQTGLRPCADDRHMVVFDVIGFLTVENIEVLGTWNAQTSSEPTPRPGSVELVQTYREKGYEILYVTTIPPGHFGTPTVEEVVTGWLQASGYPVDEAARVWAWAGQRPNSPTWTGITDELVRLSGEGVSVDAGYTENSDKTWAFATSGIPEDRNFTLTPVAGIGEGVPTSAPTTLIPNDDLVAHRATVAQLPPICQAG